MEKEFKEFVGTIKIGSGIGEIYWREGGIYVLLPTGEWDDGVPCSRLEAMRTAVISWGDAGHWYHDSHPSFDLCLRSRQAERHYAYYVAPHACRKQMS